MAAAAATILGLAAEDALPHTGPPENGGTVPLAALRVVTGLLLGASGALLCGASAERWAGACSWAGGGDGLCDARQDHRYEFTAPGASWEPVGDAAQLAGASLLVLAAAFVLLPWALTGRRPGMASAVALVVAVLALTAVGMATLRSGLSGSAVEPTYGDLADWAFVLLPPLLVVRLATASRGWAVVAAVLLVLATPLVATFSYAVGPYDARPWWEALSGAFTVAAGSALLVAAAFDRPRTGSESPPSVVPTAA